MGQSGGKMPGNLQLAKGEPRPKGCCESPKGGEVNFTIDAPGRGSVWLYLLLPEGHEGASTLEGVDSSGGELYVQLDPSTNKTGDTWHVKLTLPGGFDPKGAKYMWILDPKLDQHGLPEANAVRILDPCAKCLDSRYAKDWNKRGGPKFSPMAVVPDRRAIYEFDWQGVKPPNLHLKDLVIYEAHVRGFTRNPDSKLQDWDATAGTFLGFIQKIPHLLKLGINAVELLPVYEFDETACPRKNPENGEQLCNFWGYSTVNFFVPMQRFSSRDRIGAAIVGFKTLVRELHRQGIEVILDVVFNHTAEGAWGEHFWHSWAAIAKNRYYILSNGQDTNYTGCGNTVNANDPMCSDWIVECLSYWVDEMHVDGFRFDLASALTRGNDGKVSMDPLLIKKMANEPKLKRAKFIAEAWDCSWPDGYLVGKFPSGGPPRWAEWNGIFRDTIRCFIKGDEGKKGDFATRICGSSDLFKHNGRKPFHSINFITAHDGFTLKDLVSYNGKHNTCNGENSGDDHNNSWNCGHEGDTGDGGVNHLRSRQIRNFMVALFMSAGTPMILYGDEYGRSQRGCNNGWCQDARCWFSWSDSEKQENNLMRFVRLLISLRKQYAGIFNREEFMSNKDIWWRVHWDDPYNYICYVLHDHHATGQGYAGLMVAFNAGHEVRCCDLPQDKPWYRIIDTNLPAPKDICENEASSVKITSQSYVMQPYSCIVLKTYSDKKSIKEYARTDAEYGAHQDINRHMKEVIKRRMSMEFTSSTGTPHIQDIGKRQSNEAMERMQSMVRMRSLMSGAFMDAIEEGESLETKKEEAFQPPPRKPSREQVQKKPSKLPLPAKPATGGEGAKVIDTDLGDKRVEAILYPDGAEGRVLEVRAKGFGGGELIFHWGLIESFGAGWSNAPEQVCNASWPDKTKTFPGANQTVFSDAEDDGFRRVMIPFPRNVKVKAVNFVLHQPPKGWHKPGHQDFTAEWPQAESLFSAAADRATEAESGKSVRTTRWKVRGGNLMGVGAVWAEGALVHFVTDLDTELMLHYGPGDAYNKWVFARSENFRSAPEDGVKEIVVKLKPEEVTKKFMFVLKFPGNTWVKDGADDFKLWLPEDESLVQARLSKEAEKEAKAQAKKEEVKQKAQKMASNFDQQLQQFRQSRPERKQSGKIHFQSITLSEQAGDVDVACRRAGDGFVVQITGFLHPDKAGSSALLHWGVLNDFRDRHWHCPPEECLPDGSKIMDAKACQTPFELDDGILRLDISLPTSTMSDGACVPAIPGMAFVIRVPEKDKWLKCEDGKDCVAFFRDPPAKQGWKGGWQEQVNFIIESETKWGHMTLMHRYNNCRDMIQTWSSRSNTGEAAMRRMPSWSATFNKDALRRASWSRLPSASLLIDPEEEKSEEQDDELWSWIFVWQRFSFMRLLDWQRNYNTKPRELAGATDSLANKICSVWKEYPNIRLWARWTLATIGRGGNQGQAIRDEILHIMHRNKIPETKGHFYEEWHQKLHNNTTPDDVGICKAFLTSVVGHIPLHGELRALLVDWTQLAPECANLKFGAGPAESALMLKALCDRLARVVGEQVDTFQTLLAPKATTLGQAVGVEKNVLEVFVDEVLRGSALFALSLILKRLEPQLRSIAQLPPWQMISAVDHPVQGELVSVPRMLHMQDKIFETPTIMLSGLVSGEEEVPVGVQAVLVRDAKSAPDILSHCAVRARNSGVLLASCYDSTLTEKIEAELLGQWVQVVCSADGSVEIKAAERPMADPKRMRMMARSASRDLTQELMSKETDSTKLVNMNLKEDFGCKWVVTPEKMDKSKVGSKSLNLALLKPQLPKDILTPQAVAMPYGSMQKALTSRENAKEWLSKLEACLAQLQPTSSNEDAKTIFQEAQVYVNALQMPSELDQALRSAMEEVGSKEGEKRLLNLYHRGDAWDATKQVWASLFGLRPWVSLAKAGRSFYDLNMAVLVQELLPAKYAFVLHTKNPFTNDPNEVYGEVVPGRGETLVGNYPGRALSFRARKGETPVVTSFLSKSTLLRTQECLIFRSDSNGEDLEGFAGAGLFESICATSDIPCMVRFHRLRLLTDHSFRQTLLSKLAEAGRAVEKAFGSPQDIEGCVDPQDRIFIVQSRPQV
ncbi:unnamed protein product [Effrenium voratum]|uniref:Glycosyl hydrolase family 13 catalytic domain-containing protein n=1 Tax=Effrenium voratum TaxID=2562239 RepID=A0AA36NMV4_9DINO|nr:unnamed protein product [Effrenium voratum]